MIKTAGYEGKERRVVIQMPAENSHSNAANPIPSMIITVMTILGGFLAIIRPINEQISNIQNNLIRVERDVRDLPENSDEEAKVSELRVRFGEVETQFGAARDRLDKAESGLKEQAISTEQRFQAELRKLNDTLLELGQQIERLSVDTAVLQHVVRTTTFPIYVGKDSKDR